MRLIGSGTFLLLVVACAAARGWTNEEVREEVARRVASGHDEACREVEVIDRVDGGATFTKWALSARCRRESVEGDAPEVTRYFVAIVQPASSRELRSLRRVTNIEDALAAGRPVELPEAQPSSDAVAATVFLVLPALIAAVIAVAAVIMLASRRRERLKYRPGAGIRVPHEPPRPGQTHSHWTINRD